MSEVVVMRQPQTWEECANHIMNNGDVEIWHDETQTWVIENLSPGEYLDMHKKLAFHGPPTDTRNWWPRRLNMRWWA